MFTRANRVRNELKGPLCALLLLLSLLMEIASGHTPSETYLTLTVTKTNLTGQWDVALRDLQQGLGLETIDVKSIPPQDLARRQEALALDTVARLEIKADGSLLQLTATDYYIENLALGEYARVQFVSGNLDQPPSLVEVNGRALFAVDVAMHGVIRLDHASRTDTVVFNADKTLHAFKLSEPPNRFEQWASFVWEGVWHIWIGFDHILFLVALLLPAVLRLEGERWISIERFRPAFLHVLKIVTAFTVAHSITLSLAALNIVQLPARLVESVIAASVALAALNNLWPLFRGKGWMVAFGFGLIHGFGFALVLQELELNPGSMALALVGFNVGVELGQLAIVAAFLPLAFVLRRSWFYRTITFRFGSAAVVLIAAAWMIERMLGLEFMPF